MQAMSIAPSSPLVELKRVAVAYGGNRVLHEIDWTLNPGENWAIVGPNGSGKSTLLKVICGEVWPTPVAGGVRTYGFGDSATPSPIGIQQHVALVSAEQQTKYQRSDWNLAVWQVVYTGLRGTDLIYGVPEPEDRQRVLDMMALFGIELCADVPFKVLSQGNLRKVLLARAMIRRPKVLICDEIGVGLDPPTRTELFERIQQSALSGTQVIMVSHRHEDWIDAITHVLELRNGRILSAGPIAEVRRSRLPGTSSFAMSVGSRTEHVVRGNMDREPVIELVNADVAVDAGRIVVLRDISWTVHRGDHWFITGPNGAGKTTLLKLLLGEWHVSQGGSLVRFGDRTLRSVWEIKKNIGYVSPEFQSRYSVGLSAREVVATGYSASVGWLQQTTQAQQNRVSELIDLFGLAELGDRSILEMSYGQARKVLIARAMVTQPRLLLLDEVFDGLDAEFRASVGRVLAEHAASTTVVLVSHYEEDCLDFMTHRLRLLKGVVAATERL